MPFDFKQTDIEGLVQIQPKIFSDTRGSFIEGYKWDEFSKGGVCPVVSQMNISYSKKNVIRGLHFQSGPKAQSKIVHVLKGYVIDVVVDIRPKSKTFKAVRRFELSDEDHAMLFIPPGFAHGFRALSDDTIFVYLVNNEYDPDNDKGIRWDDPYLNIDWGIPASKAIVSPKDQALPILNKVLSCGGLQDVGGYWVEKFVGC